MNAASGRWLSTSRALACSLALALSVAGCGNDGRPSSPSPSPSPNAQRINGTERIGWDQRAADTAELANFGFVLYVDDNRVELNGVQCDQTPASGGFPCSVRLPALTGGLHRLALAAFARDTGAESPRSSTIEVIVGSALTAALADDRTANGPRVRPDAGGDAIPRSLVVTTRDGVRLRGAVVATGLNDPVDVVAANDRVFIAERSGAIRTIRNGALRPDAALRLDDVVAGGGRGLLSIAVDPEFDRNGWLYAVYTSRSGFRLARFRAAGDTLGERAILLDGIDPGPVRPAAAVRFGPDGRLYVAVDDAGVPARAGDLGSFNGKVLRLNADATTPRDQPGGSPVHVTELGSPRGLSWGRGALWVVEDGAAAVPASSDWLRAVSGGRTLSRYRLPSGTRPAGLAVHPGGSVPALAGDLLVAARDGRALLRLRTDPAVQGRVVGVERLLHNAVGRIQAVTVEPSGSILIANDTALYRLSAP